jgi:RNA 2',3'-cyclic 3'-phosphodiesterase
MNNRRELNVRLFTGIPLSDLAREHVIGIVDSISGKLPGVRWVPTHNLHVTLKFLGQCRESLLGEFSMMIQKTKPLLPFHLEIGRLGAFPSRGSGRVIWVGASDIEGKAGEAFRALDAAAAGYGIKRERRTYAPHVTIGRARKSAVALPVELTGRFDDSVRMEVDRIDLYRSESRNGKVIYTIVDSVGGWR